MASIKKTGNGWRAQIYVKGVRDSGTFDTLREAREWASDKESELRALSVPVKERELVEAPNKLVRHERKYLSSSDLYDSEHIIAWSHVIPGITGIYFLIRNNKIVYVGQSVNVYGRIAAHAKDKLFDRVSIIECSAEHLDKLELLYIRKFDPMLNVIGRIRESADISMSAC